jgi:hypothetical protein
MIQKLRDAPYIEEEILSRMEARAAGEEAAAGTAEAERLAAMADEELEGVETLENIIAEDDEIEVLRAEGKEALAQGSQAGSDAAIEGEDAERSDFDEGENAGYNGGMNAEKKYKTFDELKAAFKAAAPEEYIAERERSMLKMFLTPYTAEQLEEKGTRIFLTGDGVASF